MYCNSMAGLGLCTALIGIALFSNVYGQDPTVTIKGTDPNSLPNRLLVANQDVDITMDCYVENLLDNALVRWQRYYKDPKDGIMKTQLIAQDMALPDNIHYSLEKPTQYTWRLRIRGAQVSDEGNYTCFVQLTQITRTMDFRVLRIVISPYLDPQQTSPDTVVDEGDNLDLICNATGRPYPTVFWSRLGGALLPVGQEKFEGPLLKLRNIKAADRGTYRCSAMNSVGTITNDIQLGVRFQPYITIPRPVISQAVGYRVEMQCFIEANPFPSPEDAMWRIGTTTYTITSDGYQVNWIQGAFNRLTYELVITDVQSTDFGTYTCTVKNDKGNNAGKITLQQTDVPQKSIKLSRVIKGNENPETASAVNSHGALLLTIASALLAALLSL